MSVKIHNDGTCSMADVKKTKAGFSLNRRALHTHHSIQSPRISLASPISVEQMRGSNTRIFSFQLPAPLNAYIYPDPIYAIRTTEDGTIEEMTIKDFEGICQTLGALALKPHETSAVYDVPAIPFTIDGDEEAFEEDDEGYADENNDDDNESIDNNDDIDEDDDWQDDDDDIVSAA